MHFNFTNFKITPSYKMEIEKTTPEKEEKED